MDRNPEYPGIWQSIGLTLMFVALMVVGTVFVSMTRQGLPPTPLDMLMVTLMSAGVVIGWAWDRAGLPFRELYPFDPFPLAALLPLLLATFGASVACSEMDNALRRLAPVSPEQLKSMRQSAEVMLRPAVAPVLLGVVVAPLAEEMIFRGLILRGLLRRFRQDHAIALSALLFAVIHVDLYQVITVFFMGLFLGWVFTRTGSLWACLLAHAAANGIGWVAVNLFGLSIQGYTDLPAETALFHPPWFDALGVAALAVGGYLFWLVTRAKGQTPASAG